MRVCHRCQGTVTQDYFEDLRMGPTAIVGWKCINCGACGDLPDASWKWRTGSSPGVLQVEGG